MALRVGPAARASLYVKADAAPALFRRIHRYNVFQRRANRVAPSFPDTPGAGIGIGTRAALNRHGFLGALVGVDGHSTNGRRHATLFVETDLTLRLVPHVAAIGAVRYMTWHNAGVRYWYAPLTIGMLNRDRVIQRALEQRSGWGWRRLRRSAYSIVGSST